MRSSIILLCGAALFSCANQRVYLNRYQIIIPPSFTTDEIENIGIAASNWEKSVHVSLPIKIADCSPDSLSMGEICFQKAAAAGGTDGLTNLINQENGIDSEETYATIYLYPRTFPPDEQNTGWNFYIEVVSHELGHAMGLVHVSQINALMYPDANQNNWTVAPETGITKNDIDQYNSFPREDLF